MADYIEKICMRMKLLVILFENIPNTLKIN